MNSTEIDEVEIELRLSMLKHWYGGRLTDEQWAGVREGSVRNSSRCRKPFARSNLGIPMNLSRSSRHTATRTDR